MPLNSTPPLESSYNRLLQDGKPFLFRGVVYQLPFRHWRSNINPSSLPLHERYADRDVLNDTRLESLKRDLVLLKELGLNALWTYTVCTGAHHDKVMKLLSDNDIYVFVGCSAPGKGEVITRMSPRQSYEPSLLERCYSVVDAFSKYDNVAGFVVSEHAINNPETTKAAEVIKAVVRDVKAYVALTAREHGRRSVPVGLAEGSWTATQTPSLEFYAAGPPNDRPDFYACVDFSWSVDRSIELAGLSGLVQYERFAASKIPVLISEYGSNVHRPRRFEETSVLYDVSRRKVFSGGFAYEFFEAANRYGLVKEDDEGLTRLEDFRNLQLRLEETRGVEEGLHLSEPSAEVGEAAPYPPLSDTWRASAEIPQHCPLPAEEYLRGKQMSFE